MPSGISTILKVKSVVRQSNRLQQKHINLLKTGFVILKYCKWGYIGKVLIFTYISEYKQTLNKKNSKNFWHICDNEILSCTNHQVVNSYCCEYVERVCCENLLSWKIPDLQYGMILYKKLLFYYKVLCKWEKIVCHLIIQIMLQERKTISSDSVGEKIKGNFKHRKSIVYH